MEQLTSLYYWVDSLLIYSFRLIPVPILGYYLGSAVVALLCVILGQLTIAAAFTWNRRYIDSDNHRMIHMHNLSMRALLAKDKIAYKKINREANDAFGKVFFAQIALAVSSLWPLPLAIGWMQSRFLDVTFPLPVTLPWVGDKVGYLFTFLPIYILVYILFGKIKRWLPFFRKIARILDQYDQEGAEKMIRITDLVANPEVPRQGDCA